MKALFVTVAAITCVLLFSCRKTTTSNSSGCITGLRLTPSDSIPFAGDTIHIYSNQIGFLYNWTGPQGIIDGPTGSSYIAINNIKIYQSGWYHCSVSETGCNTVADSVYIRVRYPQGSPSCSLTNNVISNTAGLPTLHANSITKSYDPGGYGGMVVSVYGGIGYPEYEFVFNSNNGNKEPEDGVYYTTNLPVFDADFDANAIYIQCTNFFLFVCHDNQKVYVSHVNGKLRISFCSITASSSEGYKGAFTGQVTEQ